MNTIQRLTVWGIWAHSELSHLNFTRCKFLTQSNTLPLTDDELQKIDGYLAQLKKEDEKLFTVIKGRFIYRENYKQLAKRLKKSVRVIGALISEAIEKYEVIENENANRGNNNSL